MRYGISLISLLLLSSAAAAEVEAGKQAWDVAAYIDARPRPQDPRYDGSVEQTDERHHDHLCFYSEVSGAQPPREDGEP